MAIFTDDKLISNSRWLDMVVTIQILNDDGTILDELNGVSNAGTLSIDSSSYVRRTYNFTLVPTDQNINISDRSRIWIDKIAKLYIGLKTPRMDAYKQYAMGEFLFTETNSSYNAFDNSLTVSCGDRMEQLNGTQNGQLGALTTIIPAYEEKPDGTVVKYNKIRDALITIITQLGKVDKFIIDDIGEFKGLKQYNSDYLQYRKENPQWDCVPYDLEFSTGVFVADIIREIIELYPNYDCYFDENGVFIARMKPSSYEDPVVMDNDEIQEMIMDESSYGSLTTIRNVVHIWGQTFDVNYYTDNVTNTSSVYKATIEGYGNEYISGDIVALKIPSKNSSTQYININNIGNVQLYDENSDKPLPANTLDSIVYVFKFIKTYVNSQWVKKFYLLGQWQAHGLYALVDGSVSTEIYNCSDGTKTTKYSKKYFQDLYGVDSVGLRVIPDSPFSVQKIGERLDTKSGAEYENIQSDSLALARAEYELWKNTRLTDQITITLSRILPWLKENMKISYIKKNTMEEKQYIINSIVFDFQNCTTSIGMYTFYPLYE